ncbi:MAG: Ig-like domain-containing protein, partial [Bacteroidales bacterium]|nr:Ig-like domain-containing protein [Bacteroidales bacterium]
TFTVVPITGLGVGSYEATVTVSGANVTSKDFNVTFEVTPVPNIPVTGVTLNETDYEMELCMTKQLIATVSPNDATNKAVIWSSSNPAVATVSPTGLIICHSTGTAIITVTTVDGGFTAECELTVVPCAGIVSGIEITNCPENEWLFLYDNLQMEAQVLPPTAINQNVVWFSNNPNVATVDQTGLVTAKGIGVAIVRATTVDGGHIAECFIRVISPVAGVTLNKSTTILAVGGVETLKATVYPENASVKDVKWSSANEGVATVVDGKVTGVAEGTTTITVTTVEGGYTATCVVTVVTAYITPTGITMNPTTLSLDRGKSHQLKADVKPAGANPIVTWSSSNTTIATVDDDGIVTAKAAGKATITAKTVNGYSANCTVTVTIPVESIEVTPEDCTLALKGTKALKAAVFPSDATNKTIVWSSSNTAVATVNTSGTVTAKADGIAEIYATNTASGVVGICIVTVGTGKSTPAIATEEPNLEDIMVYPNPTSGEITIENGELKIENVEIFDIMGKKITFNFQLSTFNSIDLSHLPTGVYFLRIQTESGIVVRRVVKQ